MSHIKFTCLFHAHLYALDSAFQGRTYQSVSCMPAATLTYELMS